MINLSGILFVLLNMIVSVNILSVQINNDEIQSGVELFKSGEMEHAKTFSQDYVKSNSADP